MKFIYITSHINSISSVFFSMEVFAASCHLGRPNVNDSGSSCEVHGATRKFVVPKTNMEPENDGVQKQVRSEFQGSIFLSSKFVLAAVPVILVEL